MRLARGEAAVKVDGGAVRQDQRVDGPQEEDYKPGCLEIFEREKAEGTEMTAIIGAIREWRENEEMRLWEERLAADRRRIEDDRIALEQSLLSGADCKWTPINKSAEIYCRKNGRTYRLSPKGDKLWDLHRIGSVEDKDGDLVGIYRTRGDATKAVTTTAYQPDLRR